MADNTPSRKEYDFAEIDTLLEEMQTGSSEDGTKADVIIAPHDEPGFSQFEVTADEEVSPPEFLLALRDTIDEALEDGDYGGQSASPMESTVFLEEAAEDMFIDFERGDRP